MNKMNRRRLLARGLCATGALILVGPGCSSGQQCYTGPASGLRKSLDYVEHSDDPAKVCAGCQFFTAGAGGGDACGHCRIFNGPANPAGHCSSWSAKSA